MTELSILKFYDKTNFIKIHIHNNYVFFFTLLIFCMIYNVLKSFIFFNRTKSPSVHDIWKS